MRVLVFFDLPVLTSEQRREYRRFRKYLVKNGFVMVQESVYAKLALNSTQVEQIVSNIKDCRPKNGLVQILPVTEKQFSKMEYISGKVDTDIITSDDRLLII